MILEYSYSIAAPSPPQLSFDPEPLSGPKTACPPHPTWSLCVPQVIFINFFPSLSAAIFTVFPEGEQGYI
jgi:hypothetical protein